MSKHTTKAGLLDAIQSERTQLEHKIAGLAPGELTGPGTMGDWSVKDLLAHLVDWEQRFLGWYQASRRGETPNVPAEGMTWRDLAILNRQGYERHRDQPLQDVLAAFRASYEQLLAVIEDIPEDEMLAYGRYVWTGKNNLMAYIAANTSDHYRWATAQIRPSRIRRQYQGAAASSASTPSLAGADLARL